MAESVIKTDKKPVLFGKVGEVTEQEERVLVPLFPMGHDESQRFMRTIVYDLLKLGYEKEEINDLYDIQNPDEWEPEVIKRNTRIFGRTIIDLENSPEVGKPKFVTKPVTE